MGASIKKRVCCHAYAVAVKSRFLRATALGAVALAWCVAGRTQAQLATYTTAGLSGTPAPASVSPTAASGTAASALTRTGTTANGKADSFSSTANLYTQNSPDLRQKYEGYTLTPSDTTSSVLFVTGITANALGSGTAPNGLAIGYSTDGFSTYTYTPATITTTATTYTFSISLITNDTLGVRLQDDGTTSVGGGTAGTAGSFSLGNASNPASTVLGSVVSQASGNIALTANTEVRTTSSITLGGVISGAYSLTKNESGTLTLSGGNSFSQGMIINNGTVNANAYNALGSGGGLAVNAATGVTTVLNLNAGAVVFGFSGTTAGTGTATVNISSGLTTSQYTDSEYDGVLAGAGGFTKGGTGTLYLTNASNSYTGGTTINGGAIAVNGLNRIGATSGDLNLNGGTYQITTINGTGASFSSDRNIVLGSGGGTVQVDTGLTYTASSNASVSGSAGLTKTGVGSLVLAGANSYSGGTTVTAGTLLVNNTTGSGTGTGAVAVNGGLLGGSGTSTGAVTVASGATISAGATGGDSIGKLTVGDGGTTTGLTLNGTLLVNLNVPAGAPTIPGAGSNYDQVSVAGALTLNMVGSTSTSALSLRMTDNYGMVVGQVFYIALNDGVDPIVGTFNGLIEGSTVRDNVGDTYTLSYLGNGDAGTLGNDISLTVTGIVPVPEPATIFGDLLLAGALGWNQRRRLGGLAGLLHLACAA